MQHFFDTLMRLNFGGLPQPRKLKISREYNFADSLLSDFLQTWLMGNSDFFPIQRKNTKINRVCIRHQGNKERFSLQQLQYIFETLQI